MPTRYCERRLGRQKCGCKTPRQYCGALQRRGIPWTPQPPAMRSKTKPLSRRAQIDARRVQHSVAIYSAKHDDIGARFDILLLPGLSAVGPLGGGVVHNLSLSL